MCELDIIFNFEKAYFILDEFLMGGEVQETSKESVNRSIEASDMLQEVSCSGPHTVMRRDSQLWFERVTSVARLALVKEIHARFYTQFLSDVYF